jgi:DNA-binding response OmpR family regulator
MTPRPAKILLVDDDAATRAGLMELLTGAGYDARAASTFEEGMRALRADTPDLLIADVRLGAFNGLQLLVSSPRSVPAIVITGFADPVLESDAHQHGADYVLKPVTPSVLLDMVRRRLAQVETSRFDTLRRWERISVPGGIPVRIDDQPARILDVSYGGLRFQMPRTSAPPVSVNVSLTSPDVAVRADVVWHAELGEHAWLGGAAVSQTDAAVARDWRTLVDSLNKR